MPHSHTIAINYYGTNIDLTEVQGRSSYHARFANRYPLDATGISSYGSTRVESTYPIKTNTVTALPDRHSTSRSFFLAWIDPRFPRWYRTVSAVWGGGLTVSVVGIAITGGGEQLMWMASMFVAVVILTELWLSRKESEGRALRRQRLAEWETLRNVAWG